MSLTDWRPAVDTFRCWWCDRVTADINRLHLSLPTGRLICDDCRKASEEEAS